MIKVSVMYPNSTEATFDLSYYRDRHMPMAHERLGDACKGTAIDIGLGGGAPGSPAPYIAIGHLYFDSVQAFQEAFGAHAAEITADVPNYTNTEPVFQICEVVE